ncbi:DUF1465 family protein [Sphingomonas sp. OK281]|uniref:DUF1465 family protein n=1 Tax=Sphingomonas sp. OK281 TaxID=1881067 RepID=UPI0008EEDF00|nr:DUF1465 family protein [Sphingomonas sp. OK281]SFN77578.1 regulator of CtrA degradation [Sphingomonas sp. OK281]
MAFAIGMTNAGPEMRMHHRLIDALYSEAMLLADEARDYFDEGGRIERDSLDPPTRVRFSCESLKVTTRLMHVIAWFLVQRAVRAGELEFRDALDPARRLGDAPETEQVVIDALPSKARYLIQSSIDLHRRVTVLDLAQDAPIVSASPALSMQRRLASAF